MTFNYIYKDDNKIKQNRRIRRLGKKIEEKEIKTKSDIGTYKGVMDVAKMVFKNKPAFNIKNLKKEDYIAIGLTAVIAITVGVILWLIPATNGFITDMLPFLK